MSRKTSNSRQNDNRSQRVVKVLSGTIDVIGYAKRGEELSL
ncbi:hypothetical protein ABIE64_002420 [Thalassospira sp. MBR-102]|jgi:hypothetical protein|nr:hypothetical protein [Thalassospira xiamenensis]